MTKMPGYPCAVCQRESQGYAIQLPAQVDGRTFHQFCSAECMEAFMKHAPITSNEYKAIEVGGQTAGQYLEAIGKFDLRELTPEQWIEFCGKIFHGTAGELKRQADDEIPF